MKDRGSPRLGFSLVEVMVAIVVMSTVVTSTALALLHSYRSTVALRHEARIFTQARTMLDRVAAQPFGLGGEPAPLAGDVSKLFSQEEGILPVTLTQLEMYQPAGEWRFELRGFVPEGQWTIVVDHDLDGDGQVTGDLETRSDLLRITVLFEGRTVLRTVRSRES